MKLKKRIKSLDKASIIRNIILVAMGLVVFSPYSSKLALDRLHLSMSMPELLALPFCVYFIRDIRRIKFNKKAFRWQFVMMILLVLFGMMYGKFPLVSILGSARAYFWLFVFYCIFSSNTNPFSFNDLMYISLGCILGWTITSLYGIQSIILQLISGKVTYGVLLAIPIFLSTSYIKKKYLLMAIGIIAIMIICVTSGTRRVIVVTLLSVFFVAFFYLRNKPLKFAKVGLSVAAISVALMFFIPYAKKYSQEVSYRWYYRVFVRSETYLEGNIDNSDAGRANDISTLLEESWTYILPPRGFVSRQTGSDKGAGDFNDLPLKELFWTFTLPGTIAIIGHFFSRYMSIYRRYRKYNDEESYVIVNYMTIMFALLFIEGTFLAYPYATPITGVCLGLVDRKNKRLS